MIILNDIIDHQKYDEKNPIIIDEKRTQGTKKKYKKMKKGQHKKEVGH